MAQFRKRPLIVDAEPATEDGFVEERGQQLPVFAGKDWRVRDENGASVRCNVIVGGTRVR
jgi:hypothetical protein